MALWLVIAGTLAVNDFHHRSLACPIRAQAAETRLRLNLKTEIVQRPNFRESLTGILNNNYFLFHVRKFNNSSRVLPVLRQKKFHMLHVSCNIIRR
jgi:PleD family two-component response regulator